MKLPRGKKKAETPELFCEFCKREFKQSGAFVTHVCEQKRRWNDKDEPVSRIAFQCWLDFMSRNSISKKQRTFQEFMKSPYYIAFKKLALYCINVKCSNPLQYLAWLCEKQIKIDTWNKDKYYNQFLMTYLRSEDPFDALERSVKATQEISEIAGIECNDCFRYANQNRIIQYIVNGRISPWMLYQSNSGQQFLENLNEAQQLMIIDYINPEMWSVKFRKYKEETDQIKNILALGGY